MSSPSQQLEALSLIDPVADQWLTKERLERLEQNVGSALEILFLSGQFTKVLDYWIRVELAKEAMSTERIWPHTEREVLLSNLRDEWTGKNNNSPFVDLPSEQLDLKLLVNPGSQLWAREQWSHRLESLFLQKKSSLDCATFWLLRVKDKYLAQEIYYRLCDGEESFKHVVAQFGTKEDQGKGGYWKLQPLGSVPYGLAPVLESLNQGEVTPPMKLGSEFAIIQLESCQLAKLDESMEKRLLMTQLQNWIEQIMPTIQKHLITHHYS